MPEPIVTASERGMRGRIAVEAKYGKKVTDSWRRRGGRKPNRTLAQIEAGIEPQRQRPSTARARSERRREEGPIGQTQTRFS